MISTVAPPLAWLVLAALLATAALSAPADIAETGISAAQALVAKLDPGTASANHPQPSPQNWQFAFLVLLAMNHAAAYAVIAFAGLTLARLLWKAPAALADGYEGVYLSFAGVALTAFVATVVVDQTHWASAKAAFWAPVVGALLVGAAIALAARFFLFTEMAITKQLERPFDRAKSQQAVVVVAGTILFLAFLWARN